MRAYAISDIHGCLIEFNYALSLIENDLSKHDTCLIICGDFIHGGEDSKGVLDRIIELQENYGTEKVIALAGNHDLWLADGSASLDNMLITNDECYDDDIDYYKDWISSLPLYYEEGNTIFVHAGIDEQAGEYWDYYCDTQTFTSKYPAEIGKIVGLDKIVVAGHVGTSEIANNPNFHDIYYDGASHYYIDGTVLDSGEIPVLMVDTEKDEYFKVTEYGLLAILPYDEAEW